MNFAEFIKKMKHQKNIEKIDKKLISEFHFNKWEKTDSFLKWFVDISNKNRIAHLFNSIPRKASHPSIKIFWQMPSNLQNCISDDKDLKLIMRSRNTLLFSDNEIRKLLWWHHRQFWWCWVIWICRALY